MTDITGTNATDPILNGTGMVKDRDGDYVVLADYGSDGLGVLSQHLTLASALRAALRSQEPAMVLKMVRVTEEE